LARQFSFADGLTLTIRSALPDMPITLQFANQVIALRRQRMTVAQMAETLCRSEAEILDAHCMLGLGIADRDDDPPRSTPSDEERAALRERIPKKWQGHYGSGES
jgi:hypothetical protein